MRFTEKGNEEPTDQLEKFRSLFIKAFMELEVRSGDKASGSVLSAVRHLSGLQHKRQTLVCLQWDTETTFLHSTGYSTGDRSCLRKGKESH